MYIMGFMAIEQDRKCLEISKDVQALCLEKGLTIEAALKKVARDYSEVIKICQE